MKHPILILRLVLALICTPAMAEGAGEVVSSNEDEAQAVATSDSKDFISCNGKAKAPIRVVYDITRGVQTARVFEGDKEIRKPYRISGGRNRQEYNEHEGRVCAFTSVGVVKPKQLIIDRKSRAHGGAPMPFYVDLHSERAVGGHAGDTSGYSGGCIRQGRKDAKWLYDFVKEHSNTYGNNEISCSDVTFEIVDNTPGVAKARAACFAKIGRADPILALEDPIDPPLPRQRPFITGDPLPTDRFSEVVYVKERDEKMYRYLDEGMQPQFLPIGTDSTLY